MAMTAVIPLADDRPGGELIARAAEALRSTDGLLDALPRYLRQILRNGCWRHFHTTEGTEVTYADDEFERFCLEAVSDSILAFLHELRERLRKARKESHYRRTREARRWCPDDYNTLEICRTIDWFEDELDKVPGMVTTTPASKATGTKARPKRKR
jgi:hypothetical protein